MAFSLPNNWEQDTAWILPDLIWDEGKFSTDPLFKHFPFSYIDANEVQYDQYANMGGLMPTRALGAAPEIVKMPPLNVFKVKPGYYGLEALLEEEEMTVERQPNTINEALDPEDRLGVITLNCRTLVVNRFRQTIGTFATSGVISNVNAAGQIVHREVVPNFQVLQPAGDGNTGPGWAANPASATPISDLIYWQTNVLNPGTSAKFGPESTLMCNPKTVNILWKCTQIQQTLVSDYGATYKRGDISKPPKINGENSINELMTGMGLPPITVYDEGYYPTLAAALTQDPAQFQYAIPDGKFAWVGSRPSGAPVGATKLTKHAGIGAPQADKYPSVETEGLSGVGELAKGIFVIADYHKMIPQGYAIQMGVNMAPFIGYYRGLAGIITG
jgi:hypothetical protein